VGVEILTDSKKKLALHRSVDRAIDEFGGFCVAFDALAAYEYARVVAARRKIGRSIDAMDAQIAAIALSAGFTLATLNAKDFEGIDGLKVIDPSA
jgi:predicted nucleic acid-binding protein